MPRSRTTPQRVRYGVHSPDARLTELQECTATLDSESRIAPALRRRITRLCYALLDQLDTIDDPDVQQTACAWVLKSASLLTLAARRRIWSPLLDAAWLRWEAMATARATRLDWRPVSRVVDRAALALEFSRGASLATRLLSRYRSPRLRSLVVRYGLHHLTPELEAAVIQLPTLCLEALAGADRGARRPHARQFVQLLRRARRRVLSELETVDPRDAAACTILSVYTELCLDYPKRAWGRRALRAVARLARHHDVRPGAHPSTGVCGLQAWLIAAVSPVRRHPDETLEVLRIGLPLVRELYQAPEGTLVPGVFRLVAAPEVPDHVAIAIAHRLSARAWCDTESALVGRAAIRAEPRLRARLAGSDNANIHLALVDDEPLDTLRERLCHLLTTSPHHGLAGVHRRLAHARRVLCRTDLLPLLRLDTPELRIGAQTLLHQLPTMCTTSAAEAETAAPSDAVASETAAT